MAFTKEQKRKLLEQYEEWLENSQAVYMMSYTKMTMKEIDELREKAREVGGVIHVTKNTLIKKALENKDFADPGVIEGTTLTGFALDDAPGLAKVLKTAAKETEEVFEIKSGYLEKAIVSVAEINALAELPPLPVMRAMLLGTINAPASQLVRTLVEPARGLAAVVKAHSEAEGAPA